jgi:hypothetical protein
MTGDNVENAMKKGITQDPSHKDLTEVTTRVSIGRNDSPPSELLPNVAHGTYFLLDFTSYTSHYFRSYSDSFEQVWLRIPKVPSKNTPCVQEEENPKATHA